MRVFALVALSGCFAPTPPAGAPCDPASATPCPGDQQCIANAGSHVCLPPGSVIEDAAPSDSPVVEPDAPPDGAIGARFEYVAEIAECVDPNTPDPAVCRSQNQGSGNDLFQMVVDLQDTATNHQWVAYVRFAVDNQIAGRTVTSIKLRVTATDDTVAPSNSTGEVFAVDAFSLADLTGTAPAKSSARLAPSQGAVAINDVVDFPLPSDSVLADQPAHFGIFPVSMQGVNYWNSSGPKPPVLIIDTE